MNGLDTFCVLNLLCMERCRDSGFQNNFLKLAFVSSCDADDLIASLELKSFVFQSGFLANGYSAMLLPRNIIRSEMTC